MSSHAVAAAAAAAAALATVAARRLMTSRLSSLPVSGETNDLLVGRLLLLYRGPLFRFRPVR